METALTAGGAYPESVDSSPRSRGGESWDEPFTTTAPARIRLMCSYGGHIVPRPHDKCLCYLGGDTRIVVVDRHTSLSDLVSKLSRSLLGGRSFTLKYQLPSEDLDSLISVTTEEDLENMIEEYDRIAVGSGNVHKPSRLRLFLFPAKTESTSSSIGSLLDDSKSETWFVDALNGTIGIGGAMLPRGLSADSTGSSVNCLLGLEDDNAVAVGCGGVVPPQPPEQEQLYVPQGNQNRPESPEKLVARKQIQDVHSVPDSPMLDTSSSFGSASSAQILSNLPPIRVRPDDKGPDPRGLEEHFVQMGVLAHKQEVDGGKDGGFMAISHNPAVSPVAFVPGAIASDVSSTMPMISPTDHPNRGNRGFSSDDGKVEQGGVRNQPHLQPQAMVTPQQKLAAFDLPIPQRASYYPDKNTPGLSIGLDGKHEGVEHVAQDLNFRGQMQSPEPSYMIQLTAEKFQQQQQLQQQQQYIHANPQLVQQQTPTPVVPFQPFYQMQPQLHSQQQMTPNPYNQQIPMFFMPIQHNPNYGLPVPQQSIGDNSGKANLPMTNSLQAQGVVTSAVKPELITQTNMYRTSAPQSGGPVGQIPHPQQLIHFSDQGMGYHPMQHHPAQSVAPAGYRYEYANPIHASPMFYAQAASGPLPSHFQAAGSVGTVISDVSSDGKQMRPSS